MDPNAALSRIRELVRAVQENGASTDDATDLADAVQDLDKWLSGSGFLPTAWRLGSWDAK